MTKYEIKFTNIVDFVFYICKLNNMSIKDEYTCEYLAIWKELTQKLS